MDYVMRSKPEIEGRVFFASRGSENTGYYYEILENNERIELHGPFIYEQAAWDSMVVRVQEI